LATSDPNLRRNWYTLSEEALRTWAGLAIVIVLGVVGFFGYRKYEVWALEREASEVIADVRELVSQLQGGAGAGSFGDEYAAAWRGFENAQRAFIADDFATAVAEGRQSRSLLLAILDALAHRGHGGEAQVVAVHGRVELRRGERGEWEEARQRQSLDAGDYVKTGANGSAEIMFADGTLYAVRPNTLLLVARSRTPEGLPGEQTIKMEYGWVNLNTAATPSRVETPRAAARVRQETEASVSFDQRSQQGQVAAFSGSGVEVATATGRQEVSGLQRVTLDGDRISAPQALPPSPELLAPEPDAEVDLASQRLVLSWQPVAEAARYALQVGRNRLFVDNLIDVENRSRTRATLGLRGEGTFEWRVAAINREGLQGPWSAPARFRIAATERTGAGDKTPPELVIDGVQTYGSLVIVVGHTEPGATVSVNEEVIAANADGSFTKTVQLETEGWAFVDVRARDLAGNESRARQRVFVENL
jgi:hypothetical protein